MLKRCTNKNQKDFHRYGGRGIKVCDRWRNFNNFLKDMGNRPSGLTLERRDINDDYSPENCYWATRSQQSRNKSNNTIIEINGEKKILIEWLEYYDIKVSTYRQRLKRGWSQIEALTKPVQK